MPRLFTGAALRRALLGACILAVLAPSPAARAQAEEPFTVLDTLGAATPETTFSVFGSGGMSVVAWQLVGPRFTLAVPAVISELGAFVNVCASIVMGEPQCPGTQPFVVQIRREVGGAPDPANILASFALSHDDDPFTVRYESAQVELTLEPGAYYALLAPQGSDAGFLLGSASGSVSYLAGSTTLGFVDPTTGGAFASEQYGAFRIVARRLARPTPQEELAALAERLAGDGPGRSLAAKIAVAREALNESRIEDACDTLAALQNEAEAQSGKHLDARLATDVVATARSVAVAIGCRQ